MSALPNIMFRPGLLDTATHGMEARMQELLLDTASRILRDLAKDRLLIAKIMEAATAGLQDLLRDVQTRGQGVVAELMAWIQPLIDAIKEIAAAAQQGGTAERLLAVVGILIPRLAEAADALKTDAIVARLTAMARLADLALGMRSGVFMTQLRNIVTQISDHLMVDYLGGNNTPLAIEAYQIGHNLRQLRTLMADFIGQHDITLDLEAIIAELGQVMRQKNWDEKVEELKTTISLTGEGASRLSSLIGTFNVNFNAPRPGPPPPEDPVSWYASWFLPEWRDGKWFSIPVGVADRFAVTHEPWYASMAFKNHSYETMEWVAEISSAIFDYLEMVGHGISAIFPPRFSNIVQAVLQAIRGTVTMALGENRDQDWVDAYKVLGSAVFEQAVSGLLTLVTASPGSNLRFNSHNFLYFVTSILQDLGEQLLYANYSFIGRELLLSALTLDNTDNTLAQTTRNHEKIMGLAFFFADIGSWIGAALPTRRHYGFKWTVAPFLVLGVAVPMGFAVLAPLISQHHIGQRLEDLPQDVAYSVAFHSMFISIPKWFLFWNILWEGNTDGGKFGDFLGYPEKESSPYLLPYMRNVERRCVQANNGIWSHYVRWNSDHLTSYDHQSNQVYSFDFTHDARDFVLAMRPGIVDDYWDFVRDYSGQLDNRLEILHDLNKATLVDPSPDPVHDRAKYGEVVPTTGQYLHGSHFGVRYAFAAIGVPAHAIKGTPVRRGQVVMLAGSTGVSGHNHLHVNVKAKDIDTLPFVFRDAPDKGTLRSYRYFTSQNPIEWPVYPNLPIYHPAFHAGYPLGLNINSSPGAHGNILAGGILDDAILMRWIKPPAPQYVFYNNALEGFLLRAEWPGHTVFKEIKGYEFTDAGVKFTISEHWTTNPPANADFSIHSGVRYHGDNFVQLDLSASNEDDTYNGCHIYLWWEENGRKYREYRKVIDYEGGDRKVIVDQNWNRKPARGAQFEIGGKSRTEGSHIENRFGFWAHYGDPLNLTVTRSFDINKVQDSGAGRQAYAYVTLANYFSTERGMVDSSQIPTDSVVKLPNTSNPAPNAYDNRFIVIKNFSDEIISYRMITNYAGAPTFIVTVDAPWDETITNGIHRYEIGGPKFQDANADQRKTLSFHGDFQQQLAGAPLVGLDNRPVLDPLGSPVLASGTEPAPGPDGLPIVQDFPGNIKARRYQSYKSNW